MALNTQTSNQLFASFSLTVPNSNHDAMKQKSEKKVRLNKRGKM